MAHEQQLGWERRYGRYAAAAAFVAAVLQIAGQVLQGAAFADRADGDRGLLIAVEDNGGLIVGASVAQALGVFCVAGVLLYLLRCVRYRRSQAGPGIVGLVALAPFLFAVGIIGSQVDVIDIAGDFTGSGETAGRAGEERAENLLDDRAAVPLFVGLAGGIALGFSYVITSLNAMRAGLLSRFMGILGIIVGVLLVLPIFPGGPFIVQVFWLAAVGALLLGKWPGGRGPAWETGEEQPWPSAAEQREKAMARRMEAEPAPEAPEEPEAPRPASRKRKRKRR